MVPALCMVVLGMLLAIMFGVIMVIVVVIVMVMFGVIVPVMLMLFVVMVILPMIRLALCTFEVIAELEQFEPVHLQQGQFAGAVGKGGQRFRQPRC